MPQATPKPLGPAELNSGDLAGRVTCLESVVHSWVEVCRELRENRNSPDLARVVETLRQVQHHVEVLRKADFEARYQKVRDRLRRIKRHLYPKPKAAR